MASADFARQIDARQTSRRITHVVGVLIRKTLGTPTTKHGSIQTFSFRIKLSIILAT